MMTISAKDLKHIAHLAYLDVDAEPSSQLTQEIGAIIDFVDTLRSLDTTDIAPLFHPFALHQRLRPDSVTEEDCLQELQEIAPLFEDNLYLVPKVIDLSK